MVTTNEPGQAENKSFSAPSVVLPKGGGAIRGIGEKFGATRKTDKGLPRYADASGSDKERQ